MAIIMIGTSCASKYHSTRERYIKLLPQTHIPEVDYPLIFMVVVLVMLERLEKRPRVNSASFPPPIFVGTTSILWFHVSPPPPRGNASVGLYIGLF
jgi:hypothetical protein